MSCHKKNYKVLFEHHVKYELYWINADKNKIYKTTFSIDTSSNLIKIVVLEMKHAYGQTGPPYLYIHLMHFKQSVYKSLTMAMHTTDLWASLLCINIARHRESCLQNFLSIIYWCLQQLAEILILWHVLIARRSPLSYSLRKLKLKEN